MQKQRQTGFTVTELIITVATFAILMPAIVSIINTLTVINGRARNAVLIHSVVENKIESLRSSGFTGVATGTTDFTSELPPTVEPPRSATYSTTLVNATLKQVDITITHRDYGATRTLYYRTYIGDGGVGQK